MPRIPSSSSVASSSAHCVSTPPRPTWAPTCNATATTGAYRRTPSLPSCLPSPRSAPPADLGAHRQRDGHQGGVPQDPQGRLQLGEPAQGSLGGVGGDLDRAVPGETGGAG